MKYFLSLICMFTLSACVQVETPNAQIAIDSADRTAIQVMVLGTYHFKASTSDVVSLEAGNVLHPDKQAELEAVARAMIAFKPTVIVTERETPAPDYIDPMFAKYGSKMLGENSNERVQIAYRIADTAEVTRVYGLDEQSAEGEPDYFPFSALAAHAEETAQGESFKNFIAGFRSRAEAEMEKTEGDTIAGRLKAINTGFLSSPQFYYQLSQFDVGEKQPAAELQAYWFMRNAKIFSKLVDVAKPGDRIIIVYGAGHKFWLEHLVENTPGFIGVDPVPYLISADR